MTLGSVLLVVVLSAAPASSAPGSTAKRADATALMAKGAWAKALAVLDASLSTASSDEEVSSVQLARGVCLAQLKQPEAAVTAFTAALRLRPGATLDPKSPPAARAPFEAALAQRPGTLQVVAEAGAQVQVDGVAKGVAPLSMSLAPGAHTIDVTAADGRTGAATASVGPAMNVSVEVKLPAPAPVVKLSASAGAVTPPAPVSAGIVTEGKTVAFLSVREGAGVDAKTAASVTAYIEGQLAGLGYARVTSSSQVAQMLGLDRTKQLLGCSDDAATAACSAELAGALNADHVLGGELAKLGDAYVLTLLVTDGRSGAALGRGSRRAERADLAGLLEEVKPMLEGVYRGDAALANAESYARGFIVGARVDADIIGAAQPTVGAVPVAPGLSLEWSARRFGAALSVFLLRSTAFVVAGRLEGRFFPLQTRLRPWVSLGVSGFSDGDVGVHGGLGVSTPVGPLNLALDGGVEWFPIRKPTVQRLAALIGLRVGWQL